MDAPAPTDSAALRSAHTGLSALGLEYDPRPPPVDSGLEVPVPAPVNSLGPSANEPGSSIAPVLSRPSTGLSALRCTCEPGAPPGDSGSDVPGPASGPLESESASDAPLRTLSTGLGGSSPPCDAPDVDEPSVEVAASDSSR